MSNKKTEPDWRAIAYQAVEALRLTREYVEPKVSLPEIEGWSWWDATLAYHRAVAEERDGVEEVETANSNFGMIMEEGDVSVAEDGDTSPHVRYGEWIRVNGVRFQLVSVCQDGSGAYIEFLEESARHLENQDVDYPRGYTHIQAQAAANRGERLGGRRINRGGRY